jgi:hypothetical protein
MSMSRTLFTWPVRILVPLLLVVAAVGVVPVAAHADHPDDIVCTEEFWGLVVEENGEFWICTYDPTLNDFVWEPAEGLWDESNAKTTTTMSPFTEMTRSRVEDLWDGLHTGADAYSGRNNALWSAPAGWLTDRTILYKWNGSAWSQCGDSGWYSNSFATTHFTPTFYWGSACGDAAYYGTWGAGYQWTGSAWNGSYVWSGYIWLDPLGFAATAPTAAPTGPAPARPRAPRGTPNNPVGGQHRISGTSSVTVIVN